jgi:hypothetical protein
MNRIASPSALKPTVAIFDQSADQADAADGRGRQDADGRWSRCRARRCRRRSGSRALGRLRRCRGPQDELAHDLRALGIAEVEVVGGGERLAPTRQVAPALGDGLLAALEGIGLAIARRDVGGHGERPWWGGLDADDAGIAARRQRIALDQRVVLLVDPAARGEVRRADQLPAAPRRSTSAGLRRGLQRPLRRSDPGPVVFREPRRRVP